MRRGHAVSAPRTGPPGTAVVVGGGFGGIAAALRLRALGHAVTLVERQARLGGRAQVYTVGGVRMDAGPTVITAPHLLDELFELFGERRADWVRFLDVAPWYRLRFHDGSHLDYGPLDTIEAEVARLSPGDVAGYRRFAAHARELFEVGFERLGDRPFHSPLTMARTVPDLIRLGAHRTLHGLAAKHMRDPRLRTAFSLQSLLIGGDPRRTTCIYALIHELERRWGVVFPEGGTGALVDALTRLLHRAGVRVLTGETVARITTHNGRATGVTMSDGTHLPAERVVANADPAHVYATMLDRPPRRRWTPRRLRRLRYSMGLYVLYITTDVPYPAVAHHTIAVGPDERRELHTVFERGELADSPSVYLHRPAATDPNMAPPGGDAFYVLTPAPNLRGTADWDRDAATVRRRVLDRLEATELPGVRAHITDWCEVAPPHFAEAYLDRHGSAFRIQPRLTQAAWFRFHNRSEEVDGLYLVGAGTHPGAGVPGVLSSAKTLERVLAAEAA